MSEREGKKEGESSAAVWGEREGKREKRGNSCLRSSVFKGETLVPLPSFFTSFLPPLFARLRNILVKE